MQAGILPLCTGELRFFFLILAFALVTGLYSNFGSADQPFAHQVYHGDVYHCLNVSGSLLVVFGEASVSAGPAEGAYVNPAFGGKAKSEVFEKRNPHQERELCHFFQEPLSFFDESSGLGVHGESCLHFGLNIYITHT